MIEDWIDEVAKTAGLVEAANGKRVVSYPLFGKTLFPESLSVFPCALTFIENLTSDYDLSGAGRNIWDGITEFHLTADLNRKRIPEVLLYYRRIRDAFAGNMTLNGKVAYCMLRGGSDSSIAGPVELSFGNEKTHFGLVAYWRVKEIESTVPVSMGNVGD